MPDKTDCRYHNAPPTYRWANSTDAGDGFSVNDLGEVTMMCGDIGAKAVRWMKWNAEGGPGPGVAGRPAVIDENPSVEDLVTNIYDALRKFGWMYLHGQEAKAEIRFVLSGRRDTGDQDIEEA